MRYLLALLTALPFCAHSQTISPPAAKPAPQVCFPVPLADKINDSLRVLPLVRKEAKHLRAAANSYKLAADTMRAAYVAQLQSSANLSMGLRDQKIEVTRARVDAKEWKGKARRRGWLNWLLALGAAAGAGLAAAR